MSAGDLSAAEAEIRKLMALYCHTWDDGRAEDYCDLFTEDGEFNNGDVVCKGRDELMTKIARGAQGFPPAQHVTYNSAIDIHGATAEAVSDFMFITKADDGKVRIQAAGRYYDQLVRTPAGWRFRSRLVRILGEDG